MLHAQGRENFSDDIGIKADGQKKDLGEGSELKADEKDEKNGKALDGAVKTLASGKNHLEKP